MQNKPTDNQVHKDYIEYLSSNIEVLSEKVLDKTQIKSMALCTNIHLMEKRERFHKCPFDTRESNFKHTNYLEQCKGYCRLQSSNWRKLIAQKRILKYFVRTLGMYQAYYAKKNSLAVITKELKEPDYEIIKLLYEALVGAECHLEYVGYGDSWERDAAGDLPQDIEDAKKAAQNYLKKGDL